MSQDAKETIEWHPAFQAAIQIEFEDEIEKLSFEPEHLLGKKPMQVDELIIKLKSRTTIKKNIGRIFKQHNIIEYKDPDDYISINDFYKVYGYCCFYQSNTEKVYEIPPEELTITFICNHYPMKLLKHLSQFRNIIVSPQGNGIYYLEGDAFPIQLLITHELDPTTNLWLRSLRKDLKNPLEIEDIISNYEEKRHSNLYQAAMNVIARANWKTLKEAKPIMCEALRELMAEEFEEEHEKGLEKGLEEKRALIRNAYESLGDIDQVSQILRISIDEVKSVLK